jgi:hypothetical protein
LFKNQISLDDIKYKIPYREAIRLRDLRIARLSKENASAALEDAVEDMM